MNQVTTSTAASSTTIATTAQWIYLGDDKLIAAIKRVLRKAAKWKSYCGCKGKFCEGYGCASLDELLAPLKAFKFHRAAKSQRAIKSNPLGRKAKKFKRVDLQRKNKR